MSALGDTFRKTREAQGLTLSDVAERIHIRPVYLAAIEAEDWPSIGPPVYVRGFVRSYARCLGLDADAAVARFGELGLGGPVAPPASTPRFAPPQYTPRNIGRAEPHPGDRVEGSRRGLSPGAVFGVLVAFALVLFVGYQYLEYSRGETVPMVFGPAPSALPTGAASESPAPAGTPADRPRAAQKTEERPGGFGVRLRDNSWLRVVVDGKVALQGAYPKGTERAFAGRSATVRVGNAGGVDIILDGKDLGPMGGLGDVAERSYQLEAH